LLILSSEYASARFSGGIRSAIIASAETRYRGFTAPFNAMMAANAGKVCAWLMSKYPSPFRSKLTAITHLRPTRSTIGPAVNDASNPIKELRVIRLATAVNDRESVSLT
jgi:hypothetical protein